MAAYGRALTIVVSVICLSNVCYAQLPNGELDQGKVSPLSRLDGSAVFLVKTENDPRAKSSSVILQLCSLNDNVTVLLDKLRFLAVEEIQRDLKLTEGQREKLSVHLKRLDEFERQAKWDVHLGCDEIKQSATRKVDELRSFIVGGNLAKILTVEQQERLDQLRRRFYLLGKGRDELDLQNWFVKQLGLSSEQRDSLKSIVEKNLEGKLESSKTRDEIVEVLNESQTEMLDDCFSGLWKTKMPISLSLAQTVPMLEYPETEKLLSSEFQPALVGGVVLVPSGQICAADIYLERNPTYCGFSPGMRLHDQIISGNLDWLELADQQREDISALRQISDRSRDDPPKPPIMRYFGQEEISECLKKRPPPNCSTVEFRRWEDEFLKVKQRCDQKLADKIKDILLPFQVESLKRALAQGRCHELGIHTLCSNRMVRIDDLSTSQVEQIQDVAKKRHSDLVKAFSNIEREMRDFLTASQLDWFDEQFGNYSELYPSIWSIVSFH